MKELKDKIVNICNAIVTDAAKDNKAANRRIRKNLLELKKLQKEFRVASLEAEKK